VLRQGDRVGSAGREARPVVSTGPAGAAARVVTGNEPEKSHRFATTGKDREGHNCTAIVWRETRMDDEHQRVVREVVLSADATVRTEIVLTCGQAAELAKAVLDAAASPAAIPKQQGR